MTSEELVVTNISAQTFTLDGKIAYRFADSLDRQGNRLSEETDIITRSTIEPLTTKVNTLLNKLDPDSTYFQDLTVVSQPLTNKYFDEAASWHLQNWGIVDNTLMLEGGKSDNYVYADPSIFFSNGNYYCSINVTRIDSGSLEIYFNETWVKTITEPGMYQLNFTINDNIHDIVKLVAKDVTANEHIVVSSWGIYFVSARFNDYLRQTVKELSTVDASSFIPRDEYNRTMEIYVQQFQSATQQYLDAMDSHLAAENPHNITCEMINAATVEHKHEEYVERLDVEEVVDEKMGDYAPLVHEHDEYLKKVDVKNAVTDIVAEQISELISVDPLIITDAPSGKLPSRYAATDITAPLEVVISPNVDHVDYTSYDHIYGSITTNREDLMYEAPKAFSLNDVFANLGDGSILAQNRANLRICYHHKHKVEGYTVTCKDAICTNWSVYNGNTTFIHSIVKPNFVENGDGTKSFDVYFDDVQEADSLSWIFADGEEGDISLKISIKYVSPDTSLDDQHPIFLQSGVKFCVSSSGTNRVVSIDDARTIVPTEIVPNIPCYIFGSKELGETDVALETTYICPEFGNVRKGISVLNDKFNTIPQDSGTDRESYTHPVFGNLALTKGKTHEGSKLTSIYSNEDISWQTDGSDSTVILTHTFDKTKAVLKGYLLNWRTTNVEKIPDTWTLTAYGTDSSGREITVVLDSVDQYYPFYSVEDDDIVYHLDFDKEVLVSKIVLTMSSKKSDPVMTLNKLELYLSEYYYSIPQNTMYHYFTPVASALLGYVTYNEDYTYTPTNLCLGKSCVVPVNNLQTTSSLVEYDVPNPFLNTNVTAVVNSYSLASSDTVETPSAYITAITPEKITVAADSPFRYAVAISRNW